ncbi:hypothetical protein HUT06_15975 [Actinomadura sp. NAK00032]|uniref:hypothetical protein n=1 Tax=Actinomadura sp. NAK00032 TaxID=2742128 RepID=UPI00158FC190|nr:hypothetical protein [Actinomadura sp. NAK00032]QKW35351.1 hypothetical protein HUT06_15975 [Actinomadura sp. NAK00032]
MWPGSNLPMGPPPAGPGQAAPSWPPPRRAGPGAGWYALPVALLLAAVVGFFTLVAFLWDDSEAADGPKAVGDPVRGVAVQLSEGYGYFLYVRTGGSTPYSCAVRAGERSGPIRLSRKNSWSVSDRPGYRYTATFEAPVTGAALLTCRGTDGPILVAPDDTAHAYLGLALFVALGVGGLAVLSFVVVAFRRSAARR